MSVPVAYATKALPFASRRLSALEATTVIATVGLSGVVTYIIYIGVGAPEVAIALGGLGLLMAGLAMLGHRWTPAFGSLYAVMAALLVVGPSPDDILRALAQPGDPLYAALLIVLPLLTLARTTGIAAAIQNFRHPKTERSTPGWLAPLVAGLVGAAVCGVALAAVPRPGTTQAFSPAVLASLAVLRTSNFAFDQPEIHVRAGETVALRLDNTDSTTHTFSIDDFGVDVPMLPGQSGVAVFHPTQAGTYIFYCAPHYDKSTGQGMHGTLVVDG